MAEGYETTQAHNALAAVFARDGQIQRATDLLERSLALDAGQPGPRRMLETLRGRG